MAAAADAGVPFTCLMVAISPIGGVFVSVELRVALCPGVCTPHGGGRSRAAWATTTNHRGGPGAGSTVI